jgi:formate dehydrogenase major subunit
MEEPMTTKQIQITIDGKELFVDPSLTLLEAARQNGIAIPTLCHHAALSNWGGCRLCVVEVDKSPKLAASCVMPVRSGMEVVTANDAITASRRMTLELLFAERNHNCMFCPDSGECELQQMAYALQMDHLTVSQSFPAYPVDVTGEYMTIDHNRCILCGRCVRACQEIAGSYVIGFHNRGPGTLIGFDLLEKREASGCSNCGACLQVCPTGAISSRYRTHYAVKGQPADRSTIASICAGCGLLCPTRAVVRDNQLIRIEGILADPNGRPDHGQLCYKGRFEVLKTRVPRLLAPMVKDEQGQWREQGWDQALEFISTGFKSARPGGLFGIASSQLSNEVLVLFKELMADRWKARVDTLDGDHFRNLAAAMAGTGETMPAEAAWKKVADADMVLIVGADPHGSHPLLLSLLRQAHIERGIPIAAIGRTERADLFSTDYLEVAEKDMEPTLAALAALAASPDKTARAGDGVDNQQPEVLADIARAFAGAKTPLILAGDQLTGAKSGKGLGELLKLARLKETLTGEKAPVAILGPGANSMAAWRLGMPDQKASEVEAGDGLVLLGDEPDAELNALADRLQPSACLVVMSPCFNAALADKAHVLLPIPLWLEEDGSYIGLNGTPTMYKPKVLDPPPGVRHTWETLQALAQRAPSPATPAAWADIRMKAEQIINAKNR